MPPDPHEPLMAKLLQAIEVSLRAPLASREAVQEILKRGAETGIFFAGARKPDGGDAFDLTEQDRDFLRSLSIRPDPRGCLDARPPRPRRGRRARRLRLADGAGDAGAPGSLPARRACLARSAREGS